MNQQLSDITHVYFVGIGGIGMSALARWFNSHGRQVAGYDKTPTPLTRELEESGISIHYKDDLALVADDFKTQGKHLLIIFTPAIPQKHTELTYFRENGFDLQKRSQVLGLLTNAYYNIAAAGTHGKTTTSSMAAHLVYESGKACAAFLGGIATNYNSNLVLRESETENPIVVVEADEYDRSFLRLFPNIGIITSVDADHMDIYSSVDDFVNTFGEFAAKLKGKEALLLQEQIELPSHFLEGVNVLRYGIGGNNHFRAENVRAENHQFVFDLHIDTKKLPELPAKIEGMALQIPGYHNVQNALAAVASALLSGIDAAVVKKALASFKGVKRRFEYRVKTDKQVYIDDYAHHPTEITAFVRSVRELYPSEKLTLIFQPHLFTRTRDFAAEFSKALSLADEVLLLNIYPAREEPIEGVDSELLLKNISGAKARIVADDELLTEVKKLKPNLLATVGAGDIDRFVQPLTELLK